MIRLFAAAGLIALVPGVAQAQDKPAATDRFIDIAQPDAVLQALQDAGYTGSLKVPLDDQPYIESTANGGSFSVQFYGCKLGRDCTSLDFYAWYEKNPTYTPDFANRWNSKKRFVSALIDDDGNLVLNQYVSTIGKTTYANFVDDIDWWLRMNGEMDTFILEEDAKQATPAAPAAKKKKP
jgi:Putative bacterial sensory transduction regulator